MRAHQPRRLHHSPHPLRLGRRSGPEPGLVELFERIPHAKESHQRPAEARSDLSRPLGHAADESHLRRPEGLRPVCRGRVRLFLRRTAAAEIEDGRVAGSRQWWWEGGEWTEWSVYALGGGSHDTDSMTKGRDVPCNRTSAGSVILFLLRREWRSLGF